MTKARARNRETLALNLAPIISLNDKARGAFLALYVTGFSKTYDVLAFLFKRPTVPEILTPSFDAVSLAFFSFLFNSPEALILARREYARALPLLGKSLTCPRSAASDSTLSAVLLCDLFEKISSTDSGLSESWMSHVNGALALVKLRKAQQLAQYNSRRLSVRLSLNLLISSVAASRPVPLELRQLRTDLEPLLDKDNPKWTMSGLVVKYADLRAAMKTGHLSAADIVVRACDIDQEFQHLAEGIRVSFQPTLVTMSDKSPSVLEKHYVVHRDHFITQVWNVWCAQRILLNVIMRDHIPIEISGKEAAPDATTEVIDCMGRQICASIPQYTMLPKEPMEDISITQKLRFYTLLWPLYVVGMYTTASSGMKTWTIEQLRSLSSRFNVRNANKVADWLDAEVRKDPWELYTMLGGYAFAA